MVKRLTPNPAAICATDGIGVLAGPTGSRSPMRDGTDGDKYKPLPLARLPSEVPADPFLTQHRPGSRRPLPVASTRSLMNQRERRRSCGGCRRVRDGRGRAVGSCSLVPSGVAVGSRVASSTRAAADASRSARSRSSTVMSSRS